MIDTPLKSLNAYGCHHLCQQTTGCWYWSFIEGATIQTRDCTLHSGYPTERNKVKDLVAVSGSMLCAGSAIVYSSPYIAFPINVIISHVLGDIRDAAPTDSFRGKCSLTILLHFYVVTLQHCYFTIRVAKR